MRKSRVSPSRLALVTIALLFAMSAVFAQGSSTAKPTASTDRLFTSFAEDATLVDSQWWEGQLEFANLDNDTDLVIARLIAAFQPWKDWELGGRVGFGDSSGGPSAAANGSGATDLEVWGKYYFDIDADDLEVVAGAMLTVPTGDEVAQLGNDSFALAAFGSIRWKLESVIISGNIGLHANSSGRPGGGSCGQPAAPTDCDGKTGAFVGGGVLFPVTDEITLSAEGRYEGKRFEDGRSNSRVLGGLSWKANDRGMLRAGIGVGLSRGAPDFQAVVSWAAHF